MHGLKVAFYDHKTDSLVEVEDWQDSPDFITMTSVQMAAMYQSGRHRMPSDVWIVFDGSEVLRIFFLAEHPRCVSVVSERVKCLVINFRASRV